MDLGISARVAPVLDRVRAFIAERVAPLEAEFHAEVERGDRWQLEARQIDILDGLKREARAQGLWNFFLTRSPRGAGLDTVEYAHLAEAMGHSPLAPEAFNCSAPDTGNMEVLKYFGTPAQQQAWLEPLLAGTIRSAFAMTEPGVASSDASNIATRAVLDGGAWLIDGEKTYISGAGDPRCKILLCLVRTDPEASRHQQHTLILVPRDTPGVEIVRPMQVFGHDDAPFGHMHIRLARVRVPEENVILGRGRGFEISQARLGAGRIHHCMRALGVAEHALELLCRRALTREAFGRSLAKLGATGDVIADARMRIEMARLLTLKAAHLIDTAGLDEARAYVSMIKVAVPEIALRVIDEAIQVHGAAGLSQDFPLARMYASTRTLRIVDGPDAVHRMVVARAELARYQAVN